ILLDACKNRTSYQALLSYEGEIAQKVLDLLQMLLDHPTLDSASKTILLAALLRFCRKTSMYPQCLLLKDVERGECPVTDGSFGEIWKGRLRGRDVCLKVVKIRERSRVDHLLKVFSKEALIWRYVSHANLLPFYGIYHLEDSYRRICLVSPWIENGNICDYIEEHLPGGTERLLLTSDIIEGVYYLHLNNIVHADLKGVNILVTSSGRACVADFGLANMIDSDILR
ncbi:kinase-like domain-containing protein, partial [Crucibulum laeve]